MALSQLRASFTAMPLCALFSPFSFICFFRFKFIQMVVWFYLIFFSSLFTAFLSWLRALFLARSELTFTLSERRILLEFVNNEK
jgi:hypothetical protein